MPPGSGLRATAALALDGAIIIKDSTDNTKTDIGKNICLANFL
jgi:hypothetical protein